jgi:hypothetical protein
MVHYAFKQSVTVALQVDEVDSIESKKPIDFDSMINFNLHVNIGKIPFGEG